MSQIPLLKVVLNLRCGGAKKDEYIFTGVEYVIVSRDRNIQWIISSKHYEIKDRNDKPAAIR